jgi:sugar phosphate isomerase/epimerase
MVRLSLNLITLKQAGFADRLDAAAKAGFDGVGLWFADVQRHMQERDCNLDEVRDLIDNKGLGIEEICFATPWQFVGKDGKDAAMSQCGEIFRAAATLGARCVVAPLSRELGGMGKAVDDLTDLCQVAEAENVRLAVEFQGMAETFSTLASALEMVDKAGFSQAGVAIDTFHFHCGGSTLESIAAIPAGQLLAVQVADCKDVPQKSARDEDRTFPGDGVASLEAILQALKDTGFHGALSVEITGPAAWNRGAADTARRAFEKTRAVVERSGL